MLNFEKLRKKETTLAELTAGLSVPDLRRLTDEMVDAQWALIAECANADVTFVPVDPYAHDDAADDADDTALAWTLGHVIVHTTASAEESAALAAELARGVTFHGRSRSEVPWEGVTTLAQCRARLEESRRMRQASLAMWPDEPHLGNTYKPSEKALPHNAITRFVSGLSHDDSHLKQIAEIVRQAKEARGG